MQNVLGYSPIQAGAAYLPVTVGIGISATVSAKLFARTGTRPFIIAGSLVAARRVLPLGHPRPRLLLRRRASRPARPVPRPGLGPRRGDDPANAGIPADQAGLAAGLLSTSQQLGSALGLAIFSAIATARTQSLLSAGAAPPEALTAGFQRALLACAIFLLAAALIATRATNTHSEKPSSPAPESRPVPDAA